jgi:hypothetical protein
MEQCVALACAFSYTRVAVGWWKGNRIGTLVALGSGHLFDLASNPNNASQMGPCPNTKRHGDSRDLR